MPCQSAGDANRMADGVTSMARPSLLAISSAVRSASATIVSVGFAVPTVGKSLSLVLPMCRLVTMTSEKSDKRPSTYGRRGRCPVRDVVYKTAARYGVPLTVVLHDRLASLLTRSRRVFRRGL